MSATLLSTAASDFVKEIRGAPPETESSAPVTPEAGSPPPVDLICPAKELRPVPFTVTLPLKTGLSALSFRVPFVAPSIAMKSVDDVAEAVVGMSLMRMLGILKSGYKLVIKLIHKLITRVSNQRILQKRRSWVVRSANQNTRPKDRIGKLRSNPVIHRSLTAKQRRLENVGHYR